MAQVTIIAANVPQPQQATNVSVEICKNGPQGFDIFKSYEYEQMTQAQKDIFNDFVNEFCNEINP